MVSRAERARSGLVYLLCTGCLCLAAWRNVMEANQKDAVALAVFGHLQQVDDAEKTRGARKDGSDIGQSDGFDGIHFNFARGHRIAVARDDVRTGPDPDAASDLAA